MDRETRKANLKKLQLPGTGGTKQQRKTRQTSKTTTTISKFFQTPQKEEQSPTNEQPQVSPSTFNNPTKPEDIYRAVEISDKPNAQTSPKPASKKTRLKRTKLDAFVFKDPQNIPNDIKNYKKILNDEEADDDLVVPQKKVKKAPKTSAAATTSGTQTKRAKSSKAKKQTTIKSAFLRNEQMFAEIAAQHCAADQFDGDDVQLALAISKSEAESKGIQCVGENDTEEVVDMVDSSKDPEAIREKLKKYGFKTAEKKDYTTFAAAFLPKTNGRRAKAKWANKFTALTLRNSETQNKKLFENIELLLQQQIRTKTLTEEEQNLSKYRLLSSLLKKCDMDSKEKILQNFESAERTTETYFVQELFGINELPAGHLLKDWSAIQGRDLTPKIKSQQSREISLQLQNVYKELEDYFSSRKKLNWTINSPLNEETDKPFKTEISKIDNKNDLNPSPYKTIDKPIDNNSPIVEEIEELDAMIALIEEMQENTDSKTKSSCEKSQNILPPIKSLDIMHVSNCDNTSNNVDVAKNSKLHDFLEETPETDSSVMNGNCEKLKYILPPTKSLDIMNVSSCSIKTQATINSTQKPRSNSPDLFADSDVETDNEENFATANSDSKIVDVLKESSVEDMIGVITYEIYSSDEVKNTSPLERNKLSSCKAENPVILQTTNTCIDLTQDDMEKQENQSKSIVEIDLFADSPQQEDDEIITTDINSNSQQSKYLENTKEDTFKLTLSLEIHDNDKDFLKDKIIKTKDDTFKFSLSMETKQKDNLEHNNWLEDDDDDVVLREIAMDQTNTSFLNFQGSKQLETCFHKETAAKVTDTLKDNNWDEDGNEDVVLQEIAMEQTNTSVLNFQGSKQLETSFHKDTATKETELIKDNSTFLNFQNSNQLKTCFHKDTATKETELIKNSSTFLNFQNSKHFENYFHKETAVKEKEIIKDKLSGYDTTFRELCNKYLNETVKPETPFYKTDTKLRKSFTQDVLPKIKTPEIKLSKIKTPKKLENLKKISLDLEICKDNKSLRKSNSFTNKTPQKFKSSHEYLSKSQSFNNKSNNSIDLTQNDDEDNDIPQNDDEDDDCLILSDDEINYSIWQANKTGNLKSSENSLNEEDAISIPDSCFNNEEHQNYNTNDIIINFSPTKVHSEFDYMSLVDKNSKQTSNDLEILNYSPKNLSPTKLEENNFDRSEFGILEEYSEPIDYTPNLCTPTKLLNDASFLNSPSEDSAPMKHYSSCHKSSQKFNDLINNIEKQSPLNKDFNDLNDFDEFDNLVYPSPIINKSNSFAKKPEGLDKLLTAEISFKESQSTPIVKTPLKTQEVPSPTQQITHNNKIYSLRYTTSPKPDYSLYTESELLKQLYNFGIKPLKRKQAVKILEYIYNQTHPIVVDDVIESQPKKQQKEYLIDLEDDFNMPSTSKACLKSFDNKLTSVSEPNFSHSTSSQNVEKIVAAGVSEIMEENKLNLRDSCGMDMLRYSLDLKAELKDENYILQTNVTKKTSQPLLPFHIAWYNLVCSNYKLHETILMYEPIDLQEIFLFLKGLGYRYDPKDLKLFFDRRCIIFRYDLTAAGSNNGKTKDNNRHVRKSKKQKSQTFK